MITGTYTNQFGQTRRVIGGWRVYYDGMAGLFFTVTSGVGRYHFFSDSPHKLHGTDFHTMWSKYHNR